MESRYMRLSNPLKKGCRNLFLKTTQGCCVMSICCYLIINNRKNNLLVEEKAVHIIHLHII